MFGQGRKHFEEWYGKGLRKSRRAARWLFLLLCETIFLDIFNGAILMFVLTSESEEDSAASGEFTAIMAILLVKVGIVTAMIVGVIYSKRRLARKYREFEVLMPHQATTIRNILQKLCAPMNIDYALIDLLHEKKVDNRVTPAVVPSASGRFRIVVPTGFLSEAAAFPERAEAMLAHELAHIKQNDVRLFETYRVISNYAVALLLPLGVLAFLASGGGVPLPLIMTIVLYQQIGYASKRSELMADVAAAYYASPGKMIESLDLYLQDNVLKSFRLPLRVGYKNKCDRISALETELTKLDITKTHPAQTAVT